MHCFENSPPTSWCPLWTSWPFQLAQLSRDQPWLGHHLTLWRWGFLSSPRSTVSTWGCRPETRSPYTHCGELPGQAQPDALKITKLTPICLFCGFLPNLSQFNGRTRMYHTRMYLKTKKFSNEFRRCPTTHLLTLFSFPGCRHIKRVTGRWQ